MSDAFEKTAETANSREVESLAGLFEGIMMYEHESLSFLNHRIVNPCGGIFLAVTVTNEGEVFAGYIEEVSVILNSTMLD